MRWQLEQPSEVLKLGGIDLELVREGAGNQLLLLHSEEGIETHSEVISLLSKSFDVICASHPGFGGSSLPQHVSTIDDLAYFYLDLIDKLDLHDAVLVGAGIGGWIAAEMVTKSVERFSHLVLAGAVGVKFTDRETQDFADIFSLPPAEVARRSYFDPEAPKSQTDGANDDYLTRVVRNREATCLLGWSPYMHSPKLRSRLHRITIPALLLWGASDEIASPAYGKTYASALKDAQFELVPEAAHYVLHEQPKRVCDKIVKFAAG
jgi:pimeloyl-ACP methyl ester carboxylesterase